jgi:hypothetical protein
MRAATSMTWKWWLNSELRRTLLLFRETLICLSYSAFGKMVPPRGNAPRSIDYQSMALLLSYGGEKSPVKVTLPRVPGVGRARCYYANGRRVVTASGLSPDRTGLRTRLLEILCICGGPAYGSNANGKWRSTRESHSGRLDGAAVFETVSSSMPDVLQDGYCRPQDKWLTELDSHQHALRHLINSQARLLFRHLGVFAHGSKSLPGRICTCDYVIRSHGFWIC